MKIDKDAEKTEKFMMDHPEILNSHADGYLLLLCLDVAMTNLQDKSKADARKLYRVVRQHLMLNYVLELAKATKCRDVREAVRPFFFKTAKHSQAQAEEFEKELRQFIERIENRAAEKIAKGETSPLQRHREREKEEEEEGEQYEPAAPGPGGLDPTEVLNSLPKELQHCFIERDIDGLKRILSEMPKEEATYHLQRCIDSGLWVPGGGGGDGEEEEKSEEEHKQSASGHETVKAA